MNLLRHSKLPLISRVVPLMDGAILEMVRGRKVEDTIRLGPNEVHAFIQHEDHSIEDLGISHNLITTVGIDLVAAALGGLGEQDGTIVSTGTSATTLVDTGIGWTTDEWKGWTVVAEETTNTPVFGNIGSNTTDTLTIDQWWNSDDSTGTTPGATSNYFIIPTCRPRFMGITADASAASAASTVLTSEQTANGLARAICTYAHTPGAATFTLVKAWSPSATVANLHRIGIFTAVNTTAAGVLVFESVLNADASVVNGDTLTVTDTVTLS